MLITKKVKLTCMATNKKHFESIGIEWEFKKVIEIPVEYLYEHSSAMVRVSCDYCNKETKPKRYSRYNRDRKTVAKDCCSNIICMKKKREEVTFTKHGVKNPSHIKEVLDKITEKTRTPYEKVRTAFEKMNYQLVSTEYFNKAQVLYFICNNHLDIGEQPATYAGIRDGFVACKQCDSENKSKRVRGSNNGMWKGGTRNLNSHLRDIIADWKRQSWLSCNSKCVITGKKKQSELTVHHLYSFKKIVQEALSNLRLPWRERVCDYTDNELNLLEKEILKLHETYPLGVVIDKEIHYHFHSLHNEDQVTPEYFKEYIEQYHNHRIEYKLSYPVKFERYFFKKKGKVKYHGVTFVVKQKNKYVAFIKRHGKSIYIGSYETEIEAAYFFNKKAKEFRGMETTINCLSDSEVQFVEDRIKKGLYNNKKSSKYKHVTKRKNSWEVSFRYKGNLIYLGSYGSEKEAAIQFNQFILENKFDKKLIQLEN